MGILEELAGGGGQQQGVLSQVAGQLHQQDPGMLGQLMGGGGDLGGGGKGALAGIAAQAAKRFLG